MPRTASTKLDSRTARARLEPRRNAYFVTVGAKRALGYLKPESGTGRWMVQLEVGRTETGMPLRKQQVLGVADDIEVADGVAILTYAQAFGFAAVWKPDERARKGLITVRQAILAYVDDLRARKGAKAADGALQKLRLHVLREGADGKPLKGRRGLGDIPVADLTLTALRQWRNGLLRSGDEHQVRRSRATANRVLASFKAALNLAFSDESNRIANDLAWRRLETFEGVTGTREDHFSSADVLRLINAARKQDPAFADLVEAGFLTGARYGELAACDVKHFDPRHAQLNVPSGKTGARPVTLTAEGVELFKHLASGRDRTAPLLSPDGSGRWEKSMQHRRIKAFLKAAKLPATASFYALRHSHISRSIEAGAPLTLIAANCGTSVAMIEQTYGKFLARVRLELVERAMPRLRVVTPIKRGAA